MLRLLTLTTEVKSPGFNATAEEAQAFITLKEGYTLTIEELPPEDRRIIEEMQAFIAAKLTRTDNK